MSSLDFIGGFRPFRKQNAPNREGDLSSSYANILDLHIVKAARQSGLRLANVFGRVAKAVNSLGFSQTHRPASPQTDQSIANSSWYRSNPFDKFNGGEIAEDDGLHSGQFLLE